MSELLKKATEVQNINLGRIYSMAEEKNLRPVFHLASPCGWINDPNGFSYYRGKVHLFFQYHPYGNKWGPMHWGHAVSTDMLNWNFLPVALAPDTEADMDGCFSGTAMEDDGNHVLIYTGVIEKNGIQHQCMAIGDGIEYRKVDFNPIISSKNIPFEYDVAHFRDPKAWKENGIYYIAAVIKTEDKSGAIALFSSNNLESWEFISIIDRSACSLGMMWECPDVFSLDGCDVIIVSPQEMKEDLEKGWHDGNNSVYMTGTLPRDTWEFKRNNVCQIDYGIDFYAPQTTLLPDGRRVLVAWMHSWESYSTPENYSWTGMMTLPRELEIKNGILFQKPVSELEALRKDKISGSEQLDFCSDGISIPKICGRHFDMGLTLNNVSSDSGWFRIHFAEDENFFTEIKIDFTNKEISFDRSRSGTRKECENFRKFKFSISSVEKFDVRLVCDINSAELFVLGGRYAFTNVFYTPSSADGISFASEKQICFDYEFYSLK